MSKIISLIIKFLNLFNKFIWKIVIFLAKYIKVEDIDHLDSKPQNVRYRQFNVDEQPFIEPFVEHEHLDYKKLIVENNIKPINRHIPCSSDVHCPICDAPSDYLYFNTKKPYDFHCT